MPRSGFSNQGNHEPWLLHPRRVLVFAASGSPATGLRRWGDQGWDTSNLNQLCSSEAARLAFASYTSNEPANLLTCDHREAMANLLKGKPIRAGYSEKIEKTQVSTSFVHREAGFLGQRRATASHQSASR
jgi:hypothetical protein